MPEQPLVSIIIPTFNRAHLIGETLDSVLAQTYQNWECLVVDDGSTDGTETLLNEYLTKDCRFIFITRPPTCIKGAPTCRNVGFKAAKGEYVWFFDSDDIIPISILQTRINFATAHVGYDFYVFQTIRFFNTITHKDCIWNDLSRSHTNDITDFLKLSPPWHTSGPLWKRSFLKTSQITYTEGVKSWQDWEFHIRVLTETTNYIKDPSENTAAYQCFHKGETINKNNSLAVTKARLELVFMIVDVLKKEKLLEAIENQKALFKLFYFLIVKIPEQDLKADVWLKIKTLLYRIPKADFWFWKTLISLRQRNENMFYLTIFRVFLVFKIIYFDKRFAVDNYNDRTWYTFKINHN